MDKLTEAQRAHILAVADEIERTPHTYAQTGWGDGECSTPCCIAGRSGILDDDPFNPKDDDPGDPDGAYWPWIERRAAAMGLTLTIQDGDPCPPVLFQGLWPARFLRGGRPDHRRFCPSPSEAVDVLRALAVGQLSPGEVSDE